VAGYFSGEEASGSTSNVSLGNENGRWVNCVQ
jgi:hypothetical protein